MARILIVEDEKDIADVLSYNLGHDGHEVSAVGSGRDGLRLAREFRPELMMLDLMLPDVSGLEVCRSLKADPETRGIRILVLTARSEEFDRVLGFELGADDYVVKPFSVRELLLRVRAILGRGGGTAAEGGERGKVESFGRLSIDREAHRVCVDAREIEMTALEFRLLVTLYERRDRVQTRKKLLDDVWGIDGEVESRTVDTHVKRVRQKLGSAGVYLETIRGVGYRFARDPAERAKSSRSEAVPPDAS